MGFGVHSEMACLDCTFGITLAVHNLKIKTMDFFESGSLRTRFNSVEKTVK